MKPQETELIIIPKPTGTPQSRRRQTKRNTKKAGKNHFIKKNKKDSPSKPRQ